MCLELTILGSTAAIPEKNQISTALTLKYNNTYMLFDCAEGTQIKLRENKIPFSRIDRIYISHLHGDHYYGIFGLITTFNLLGRRKTLTIHAPKDLQKQIDIVIDTKQISYPIEFKPHTPNQETIITDHKSFIIKAFPLVHRIPTWGFCFCEKPKPLNIKKEILTKYNLQHYDIIKIKNGHNYTDPNGNVIDNKLLTLPPYQQRKIAICTDTLASTKITQYIKGVDLLYHEATFIDDDAILAKKTLHSTAKQAGIIASQANAKQLIIGHISNRYPNKDKLLQEAGQIFPNTEIALPAKTFKIPLMRVDEK